jgi:outer membrane protein OmpA-like peptidoglycan-associated protein
LNITGLRLSLDSNSVITLVGTNSYTGEEKGNLQLSKNRALSIKNYLVNIWKINPDRIDIKARHLPEEPSNVTDENGQAENRRVEIESADWKIVEPVIVVDTTRNITKTIIRLFPQAKAESGIKNWKIKITQNNFVLKEFNGLGTVPHSLDWELSSGSESAPTRGGKISYSLLIEDSLGQVGQTHEKYLAVEQMTIEKKRIEKVFDREYEYFSLILFDYGKSKLRSAHKKVIDFIKERLTPKSKVIITGHTDTMGKDALNKRISENRAKAVAKQLNLENAQIIGEGEENLLYDNTLPEGRFYCRTVKITIETPVENK